MSGQETIPVIRGAEHAGTTTTCGRRRPMSEPDPGFTQTRDDVLWGTIFACRNAIWGPKGTHGKGMAGKIKRLGAAIESVNQAVKKTRAHTRKLEARIDVLEAHIAGRGTSDT